MNNIVNHQRRTAYRIHPKGKDLSEGLTINITHEPIF